MRRALLHPPDEAPGLRDALCESAVDPGTVEEGLIFLQRTDLATFDDVESEMLESFRLTRQAAAQEAPILYVVRTEDLLGQRGPLSAMLASGLLSAARSMGLEGVRSGRIANALAFDDGTSMSSVATWTASLLATKDVTGELISLGTAHLGKALA